MGTLEENDEAWERERARRRAERRRRRQREARIKRAIVLTAMGLFLFLVLVLGSITVKHMTKKAAAGATETAYLAMRTKIEASIPAGTSDGTDSAETVSSYAVSGDYTISGLDGASYLGSDEVTSIPGSSGGRG